MVCFAATLHSKFVIGGQYQCIAELTVVPKSPDITAYPVFSNRKQRVVGTQVDANQIGYPKGDAA